MDDFEDDNNIEETDLYKKINDDDILNDSDAEKLSKIRSNKPKKNKKKKKKKTKNSCKNKENDHNNNSNNGNNNNGFIIKIEKSDIERETLENKETYKTNKKGNIYQSMNSQKFSGSYLDYLDNDGFSANLSQKSTNNSEKKEPLIEHSTKKIISDNIKSSNSYFHPNQKGNLLFPEVKNEIKYFDLDQIIEMEKKIKEYDKKEFEILSETEDCKYVDRNSLFLDDVNHKCKKTESKNYEKDNNFINCLYIGSESDDSYKKNPDLLVKKTCRKRK